MTGCCVDPAWGESLALVGGILAEEERSPTRLLRFLERLVEANATDLFHRPMLIAAQVSLEARQTWWDAPVDFARLLVHLAVSDYAPTPLASIVPVLTRLGSVSDRALKEASKNPNPNTSNASHKLEQLREKLAGLPAAFPRLELMSNSSKCSSRRSGNRSFVSPTPRALRRLPNARGSSFTDLSNG